MGNKAQPFLNPLEISKPHNLFWLPTSPHSLSLSLSLSPTLTYTCGMLCQVLMPMLQFVAATMLDTLYPYQRLCLCQHIYILMDSRGFLTIGLTISLMVTNSSNFVFFSCLLASFAHTLQAMLIHIKGWFLQFSSTML